MIHATAFGGNNTAGPIDVATARNACASASGRMDFETETFLVQPAHTLLGKPNCSHAADKETYVVHTLRGEGFDASEDGTGRGTPLVPVAFNARQDPDHWLDRTGPLDTDGGTQAVAFAENSRAEIRLEGGDGSRCGALSTGGGKPGQGVPMVAQAVAVRVVAQAVTSNYGKQCDNSDPALGPNVAIHSMQVRRLTPRECERLQGFPDGYTDIPWRRGKLDAFITGNECPDGPRYKALGNSWAVPCVTWIGQRIAANLE